MLGDVQDGVEAEDVDEEERAHRRDVLCAGDALVDLLDREALLLLRAPDLADRGVEDPVDDEAGDLLAGDRLLADRLGEVDGCLDRLLDGVVARDDLDQRHDRRRVEEVEADDLVAGAASRRAISVIESEDVFEARIACPGVTSSSSAKTGCLISIFSGAASITKSTSPKSE